MRWEAEYLEKRQVDFCCLMVAKSVPRYRVSEEETLHGLELSRGQEWALSLRGILVRGDQERYSG